MNNRNILFFEIESVQELGQVVFVTLVQSEDETNVLSPSH